MLLFFLQRNNQRQVPKLLRIYTRREVNLVTENRLRAADSRNVFVCLYIFLKFTCHAKQRYKNDIYVITLRLNLRIIITV